MGIFDIYSRYLLTMREEFNVASIVDSLVQKGIISADAGNDVMRQYNARAQIEACILEVMKGGTPAYRSLCETLEEQGYGSVVDALRGQGSVTPIPGKITPASRFVWTPQC